MAEEKWREIAPIDHIIFQNEDVCILKPDSEYGVPVFHWSLIPGICKNGLFSYNEFKRVHPELRLKTVKHKDPDHFNHIYFRAPYSYPKRNTFEDFFDGVSIEKIISGNSYTSLSIIKVDPTKTYVYFSETRKVGEFYNIINSRILLLKYIDILQYSKPSAYISRNKKIYEMINSNENWEVIVKIPHLDTSSFKCYENDKDANNKGNLRKLKEGEENLLEEPIREDIADLINKIRDLFPGEVFRFNISNEDITFVIPTMKEGIQSLFFTINLIKREIIETNITRANPLRAIINRLAKETIIVPTFKPIWVKNNSGKWIIQCPICGIQSGSGLEIGHNFYCENKIKIPDLSDKPQNAGRRRKSKKSKKNKTKRKQNHA